MGVAPSFPVGHGKVIPGLDRGLIGLCRGSKARIVVPPRLAYGRAGKPAQGVGPDATLMYDVEVVDVRPPVPNDFAKIDANGDWKIGRGEARRYFEGLGQGIDLDALWEAEDEDDDGYISWEARKSLRRPRRREKPRERRLTLPRSLDFSFAGIHGSEGNRSPPSEARETAEGRGSSRRDRRPGRRRPGRHRHGRAVSQARRRRRRKAEPIGAVRRLPSRGAGHARGVLGRVRPRRRRIRPPRGVRGRGRDGWRTPDDRAGGQVRGNDDGTSGRNRRAVSEHGRRRRREDRSGGAGERVRGAGAGDDGGVLDGVGSRRGRVRDVRGIRGRRGGGGKGPGAMRTRGVAVLWTKRSLG
ncbi:hypothetical protein ACHAWF_013285 [Thalassiosira exigua]